VDLAIPAECTYNEGVMRFSGVKVYGYRWVVLGAFMFINLTIQVLWICFAPVAGAAAEFYRVSDMKIGLLAMIFMVVFILVAIPASWTIDRFGLRKGVGLGAVLLGACGLLRGIFSGDYKLVFLFTVGLALAQPLILNAYTTVAAKWFPLHERASASGLSMVANFAGTTVGLMLTPWLVARSDLRSMQMIYGGLAALSAISFLVLAREAPPTPASPPGFTERALVLDGLKMAVRQRDFRVCMLVFFAGVGIFNGIATWIENIVRPRGLNAAQAGMLGGLLLIGGMAGAAVLPALSDRSGKRKPFILTGMVCCIPGLLGFTFFQSYPLLLVSVFVFGFFLLGLAPIGYQYAAEVTHPAPEGTSNGLLMLAGQLSVVFIFGMEALNNKLGSFTPSLLAAAALLVFICLLVLRLKESGMTRGPKS